MDFNQEPGLPTMKEAVSQVHWPHWDHQGDHLLSFKLKLPDHYCIHPVFYVSQLKPYHSPVSLSSTEPGDGDVHPLLSVKEDWAVFTVQRILDSWHWGAVLEYLVNWEGYGKEEHSWVPRRDILNPDQLNHCNRGRSPRHQGNLPSGAFYGEGGNVRESTGSTITQYQCSQSLDY